MQGASICILSLVQPLGTVLPSRALQQKNNNPKPLAQDSGRRPGPVQGLGFWISFRAAQRVLGAIFFATLGRHSAFRAAKSSSKKVPGQDLAQTGLFPLLPEEKFNSRPGAVQNAKFELQKVPGQDLAQKGLFPLLPEEKFNSQPGAVQSAKFELQNAPGQNLDQKGRFPMISKGNFNSPSYLHTRTRVAQA